MGVALLLLPALLVFIGCRRDATDPPRPSYDNRELAALAGAGREIPDSGAQTDSGIHISDAQALLFDESLCESACDHLFELLLEEQRRKLAKDPEGLKLFEEDLERVRRHRRRRCIDDCRRLADKRAVECVKAAEDRSALEDCDF